MKTSVHELLDGMTAAELDQAGELPAADLGDEQSGRIATLAMKKAGIERKKKGQVGRFLLVAACIAAFMGALAGCYAIDEAQYRRAEEFFDLNHFSVEGLDRDQIKRVYRDITTESFTYDKSTQVLLEKNGIVYSVEGVNLSITNYANNSQPALWGDSSLPLNGAAVPDGSTVTIDSSLLNTVGSYAGAINADGNTAVIGTSVWQSMSDARYLVFRLTDPSGHLIARKETRMDELTSVQKVAAIDGGWLAAVTVRCADLSFGQYRQRIVRLGADGEVLQQYGYDPDDGKYHIEGMTRVGNVLFLSATFRPTTSKLYQYDDYEDLIRGIDPEHPFSCYTEEWRERAREEFSAILLVIDADSGEPEQFYRVGGAFAGALGMDEEGNLRWSVGRIVACGYSPATNAFSIYGVTRRYDYTFDSVKKLLKQERTDLIGSFFEN